MPDYDMTIRLADELTRSTSLGGEEAPQTHSEALFREGFPLDAVPMTAAQANTLRNFFHEIKAGTDVSSVWTAIDGIL